MSSEDNDLDRVEALAPERAVPGWLVELHNYLEASPTKPVARAVQASLQLLVLTNVVATVLETVPTIFQTYGAIFTVVEDVSIFVFVVEYALRLLCCVANPRFSRPVLGRVRYALTPMALVDLAAIAPALVPWIAADLRWARVVRLMRIFRLLKLARYSRALMGLRTAFMIRKEELAITAFAAVILLVLASSAIHLAERDVQPAAFGSVPASAWWAVTTLTTVGYGDVFPVTLGGKIAASLVAIVGVGLFALPAGLLGSAFVEVLKRPARCPHCGRNLEDR